MNLINILIAFSILAYPSKKESPQTVNLVLHPGEQAQYWTKEPEWLNTGKCDRYLIEFQSVLNNQATVTVYYYDRYYDWQPYQTILLPLGGTKAEDDVWPQVMFVTLSNLYASSTSLLKSDNYVGYCYINLPVAFKNFMTFMFSIQSATTTINQYPYPTP